MAKRIPEFTPGFCVQQVLHRFLTGISVNGNACKKLQKDEVVDLHDKNLSWKGLSVEIPWMACIIIIQVVHLHILQA
jgi:ABC-type antimicrobial peptide transport system permease subunit